MLRESQLDCVSFILMERNKKDFLQNYKQRYGGLGKFIMEGGELKKEINIGIIEQQIQTECQFLDEYENILNQIGLNIVNKSYLTDLEGMKKLANKMRIIVTLFLFRTQKLLRSLKSSPTPAPFLHLICSPTRKIMNGGLNSTSIPLLIVNMDPHKQ